LRHDAARTDRTRFHMNRGQRIFSVVDRPEDPCQLAGVYSDEIGQEGNYSFCQSLTAKELYYLRANSVRQFRSKSVFWLSLVAMLIGR
jgi:capsid protein